MLGRAHLENVLDDKQAKYIKQIQIKCIKCISNNKLNDQQTGNVLDMRTLCT